MISLTEAVPDIYAALDWLKSDTRKAKGEYRFKTHGRMPSVSRWVQAISSLGNDNASRDTTTAVQESEAAAKDEMFVSAIGRVGWYRVRLLPNGDVSVAASDRRPY